MATNTSHMANFLATDEVPDTLFGIPVVSRRENYTDADIRFFSEHPEAGGYYDLGEEEEDVDDYTYESGVDTELPPPEEDAVEEETALPPEGDTPPEEPTRAAVNAGTTGGSDGSGKKSKYDTELTPEEERVYQVWRSELPPELQYEGDYDLRGYWKDPNTVKTASSGDHFIDKYKKPNHPTFSVESMYAAGDDAAYAGRWDRGRFVMSPEVRTARAGSPDRGVRLRTLEDMWDRSVKASGDPRGLSEVFYAMTGEGSLNLNGEPSDAIINGHLARLMVHRNETDRKRNNPYNKAFKGSFSNLGTLRKTSHVMTKYDWGTGPGNNWFDTGTMTPRFDLIARSPKSTKAAIALMENGVGFLTKSLRTKGLPADAISYGDGPNGLVSADREDIKSEENTLGALPKNFRIGRAKKKNKAKK